MTRAPLRPRLSLSLGRVVAIVAIAGGVVGARTFWPDQGGHGRGDTSGRGQISGHPRVADGDSLVIDGERLRLSGIDAPELAQSCRLATMSHPCGDEAKEHLERLIGGRTVRCEWDRLDKYGRALARCRIGAVDLAAAMARDGWAIAYGAHEAEEAEARAHGRGLWSGTFDWPEDFRREARERRAAERDTPWWAVWR